MIKFKIGDKYRLKNDYFYGQIWFCSDGVETGTLQRKNGESLGFEFDSSWFDNSCFNEEIIDWIIREDTILEIIAYYPMDGHICLVNGIEMQFVDLEDLADIIEKIDI